MPEQTLVSIGLPTYNRAVSLRRAIDSALAQDYQPIELIISDNGSTDETEAICRAAAGRDSRIKYLRQPENRGAAANFQAVLDHARGDFFLWLADDDWLGQSYVARCVEVLEANSDHALVCGQARYYDDDKIVSAEPGINLLAHAAANRVLDYYAHVSGNGAFYGVMRRAHISRIPPHAGFGGDWLMIADMAFLGKLAAVNEVFINRSLNGASRDLQQHARAFGLKGFMARSPHLQIAVNAWAHIGWRSPLYQTMSLPARLLLSSRAFVTICTHSVVRRWYGQACAYLIRSHPRFKSVVKAVKNRLTTSLRHG